MLAFPSMLVEPAKKAGISVPDNPNLYEEEKEQFPKFFIFCVLQLGTPLPNPQAHWRNAELIASIPDDEILTMTHADFLARGFQWGYSK